MIKVSRISSLLGSIGMFFALAVSICALLMQIRNSGTVCLGNWCSANLMNSNPQGGYRWVLFGAFLVALIPAGLWMKECLSGFSNASGWNQMKGALFAVAGVSGIVLITGKFLNGYSSPLLGAEFIGSLLAYVALNWTQWAPSKASRSHSLLKFGSLALGGAGLVVGIFFGYGALPTLPGGSNSGYLGANVTLQNVWDKQSPIYGDINSSTKVVVFSDPACPSCLANVPWVIGQVTGRLQGKVASQNRQFPLVYHPNSNAYSRFEIFANSERGFRQAQLAISENESDRSKVILALGKLGYSKIELARALEPGTLQWKNGTQQLSSDEAEAKSLGIPGTPFFVIFRTGKQPIWASGGYIRVILNAIN